MEQPYRVPLQDAVAIDGGQLELLDDGAWVLDIPRVEAVGADHDAVGSHQIQEKPKPLRMIGEIVVMESAHVCLEGSRRFRSVTPHVIHEMFKSSRDVRECAAGMRQDDLELRILVQRARVDEFRGEDGVRERVVETRVGWPSAKKIRVQIVKENGIAQLFNPRQERCKRRLEQVIAVVN